MFDISPAKMSPGRPKDTSHWNGYSSYGMSWSYKVHCNMSVVTSNEVQVSTLLVEEKTHDIFLLATDQRAIRNHVGLWAYGHHITHLG